MESETIGEAVAERADHGARAGAGKCELKRSAGVCDGSGSGEAGSQDASLRRAEEKVSGRLPANVTELLAQASDKFCIAGEAGSAQRVLATRVWKWQRILRWWEPAVRRRALEEKIRAQLKKEKQMLTVTGTAGFVDLAQVNDPKAAASGKLILLTVIKIQPHFPHEHDLLERIAKEWGHPSAVMEQGNLVITSRLAMPAVEQAVQENIAPSASVGGPVPPASKQSGEPVPDEEKVKIDFDGQKLQCAHETDDKGKKCRHCGLSWHKIGAALKHAGAAVAEAGAQVVIGSKISE
jgi:hypothetical protein